MVVVGVAVVVVVVGVVLVCGGSGRSRGRGRGRGSGSGGSSSSSSSSSRRLVATMGEVTTSSKNHWRNSQGQNLKTCHRPQSRGFVFRPCLGYVSHIRSFHGRTIGWTLPRDFKILSKHRKWCSQTRAFPRRAVFARFLHDAGELVTVGLEDKMGTPSTSFSRLASIWSLRSHHNISKTCEL